MADGSTRPTGCFVSGDRLRAPDGGEREILPIPDRLLQWFRRGRLDAYARLAKGEMAMEYFDVHLPVMATLAPVGGDPFPNLGHKGVGPVPRTEALARYSDAYEAALTEGEPLAPPARMARRLEAVTTFAGDDEAIDPRCLGTLEIFQKTAHENLLHHPFASLLFTGRGPGYTSFQLDCGVEILWPGDARFDFLRLARSLFERANFHITQPGFVCAYIFWVVGVKEKTPYPVGHGGHPR